MTPHTLTARFTIERGIKFFYLIEWVRDKYYLHSISFLLLGNEFLNMVSTWACGKLKWEGACGRACV